MTERRLGIAEALREAIAEEMRRDERVFCIGEDIDWPPQKLRFGKPLQPQW